MKGIKSIWKAAVVLLIGLMLAMALPLGTSGGRAMAQESGVLSQESHLSLGSRLATGDSGLTTADSGLITADYPTIQAAVDAASPGDTIIVYPGTYTENVDVNKDHLTIQSEKGAEKTIVQAANPDDHVFEVTADYVNNKRV